MRTRTRGLRVDHDADAATCRELPKKILSRVAVRWEGQKTEKTVHAYLALTCITEHGQPETQISQSDVKTYQVNANNDQGDTWMEQPWPVLEAYHQSSI